MASDRGRFLRDNAFLVAAVTLPVAVAGFFLIATAIPRWTVPLPQYDLVLRVERPYQDASDRVDVGFAVRNGRVEATVQLRPKDVYTRRWGLGLFDHHTLKVREVPLDLPGDLQTNESRTFVVEALAARRVTSDSKAPDGYELSTRDNGGGGIMGELFGMGRPRRTPALVSRGRAVPLDLPAPFEDWGGWSVATVGWVVGEETPPPAASNPGSR